MTDSPFNDPFADPSAQEPQDQQGLANFVPSYATPEPKLDSLLPLEPTLSETEDKDTFSFGDILDIDDFLLFAPRGLEGLVRSVGDLANLIPGVDVDFSSGDRIFGRSDTAVGGIAEGLVQFLLPFGAAKAGVGLAAKTFTAAIAGGRTATVANAAARAGAYATTNTVTSTAISGVLADSLAFSGQEERLSNMLIQVPFLKNTVTEYLASDEGDSEAEGRLKNALEGLLLGGITDTLVGAVRRVKATRANLNKGMPEREAMELADEVGPDPIKAGEVVDALIAQPELLTPTAAASRGKLTQVC